MLIDGRTALASLDGMTLEATCADCGRWRVAADALAARHGRTKELRDVLPGFVCAGCGQAPHKLEAITYRYREPEELERADITAALAERRPEMPPDTALVFVAIPRPEGAKRGGGTAMLRLERGLCVQADPALAWAVGLGEGKLRREFRDRGWKAVRGPCGPVSAAGIAA